MKKNVIPLTIAAAMALSGNQALGAKKVQSTIDKNKALIAEVCSDPKIRAYMKNPDDICEISPDNGDTWMTMENFLKAGGVLLAGLGGAGCVYGGIKGVQCILRRRRENEKYVIAGSSTRQSVVNNNVTEVELGEVRIRTDHDPVKPTGTNPVRKIEEIHSTPASTSILSAPVINIPDSDAGNSSGIPAFLQRHNSDKNNTLTSHDVNKIEPSMNPELSGAKIDAVDIDFDIPMGDMVTSQLDPEIEERLDISIEINAITKEYLKCIAEYLNLHGVNTGDNSIEQISIAINSKEFDPSSDEILHKIQAALKDCQSIYPLSSNDEGGIPALTQKLNVVKASYERFRAYVQTQKESETVYNEGTLSDIVSDAVLADLLESESIPVDVTEVPGVPRVASTPEHFKMIKDLDELVQQAKKREESNAAVTGTSSATRRPAAKTTSPKKTKSKSQK